MFRSSIDTIREFKSVLMQIPNSVYHAPCEELDQATIGKHTRHIIELYQCLLQGYDRGEVSYDGRKRDKEIEINIDRAIAELNNIIEELEKPNKSITISCGLNEEIHMIESNYFREVLYNLEHAIHHHALIKIGIKQLINIEVPETFGVAPATIQYRKLCVQ